jgi:uncharacterized damage-inducible protein DinB
MSTLIRALASQYLSALTMLRTCVDQIDADVRDTLGGRYPYGHVAYHVLHTTDLYLSRDEASFRPQPFHREGYEQLGKPFWAESAVVADQPYDRDTLVKYVEICQARVKSVLDGETDASLQGSSGFSWLEFSRLELHIYNIRHLQHHTGQLVAALRQSRNTGVEWAFHEHT